MSPPSKTTHNVAILLFSGADILDFSGPLEILACTGTTTDHSPPTYPFDPTLIARTPTIAAGARGRMTVSADATFEEATKRIADFDILVIPGGNPDIMLNLAKGGAELEFVKAFNSLPAKEREGKGERIILSVCSGALLLAASGALKNLRATTHHLALDLLKNIDGTIDVSSTVGKDSVGRYVDGGRNGEGVRIVTAGGVTCGLDAVLYVVELVLGREVAEREAGLAEHEWRRVGN